MMQQQSARTEDFSSRLQQELSAANMKQVALATRCGVSESRVSEWLKGKSRPQPRTLAAIAQSLGVEPEWLLTGTGTKLNAESQSTGEQVYKTLAIKPGQPNLERDIPNSSRDIEVASKFRVIAEALNDIADIFDPKN